MTGLPLAVTTGVVPVVLYLIALVYLDSYKLVRLRFVVSTVIAGCLVALASWAVHAGVLRAEWVGPVVLTRYVAPVGEEVLKAAVVVFLIRTHRVGFLVDAAIVGFAVGAGFAILENVHYAQVLGDARPIVWFVRGFGTAVMHGGTTAIFAMISRAVTERHPERMWSGFVPGFLLATAVHSAFNHFFLQPLVSTALVLISIPVLVAIVFERSERALERWLDVGFDSDVQLLELIHSGRFGDSRIGAYLRSLTESFRGEVVADMLCFLRLHLEVSIRAKGELMLREAGFKTEPDAETREKLKELRFLERSIGSTGKLAMRPFLRLDGKERWQMRWLDR